MQCDLLSLHYLSFAHVRRLGAYVHRACLALAFLCPSLAFGKFGDLLEVHSSSPIPGGWVIVEAKFPPTLSSVRAGRPSGTLVLKDLRGANSGARELVLAESPIPGGWVITEVKGETTMSSGSVAAHGQCYCEILCIIDPPMPESK